MFEPVIKWSGSKRSQAINIVKLFPKFDTYYEPFVGGGSVLYAVMKIIQPKRAVASDICKPLIEFWQMLQKEPDALLRSYTRNWEILQEKGAEVYYRIRERFNKEQDAEDLFFLSRTCVNGLIRFNQDGEFNNSFHLTRKGIRPDALAPIIYDWSDTIQHVKFIHTDYKDAIETATRADFIYLDPPYFNTKGRYYGTINYEKFIDTLARLNAQSIKYALSYDGIRGTRMYLKDIPKTLYKKHKLLESGNSSFKKVMDKEKQSVYESMYLNFEEVNPL